MKQMHQNSPQRKPGKDQSMDDLQQTLEANQTQRREREIEKQKVLDAAEEANNRKQELEEQIRQRMSSNSREFVITFIQTEGE